MFSLNFLTKLVWLSSNVFAIAALSNSKWTNDALYEFKKGMCKQINTRIQDELKSDIYNQKNSKICPILFSVINGPFKVNQFERLLKIVDEAGETIRLYEGCLFRPEIQPTLPFSDGDTLIHAAITVNKVEFVLALLQRGVDPNRTTLPRDPIAGHALMTPLHYVAIKQTWQAYRLARLLVSHKGNPHQTDGMGRTSLHVAAGYKRIYHTEFMILLIRMGLNIDAPDAGGATPLHYAAASDSAEAVQILLQHSANIEKQDMIGDTPIHTAAFFNASSALSEMLANPPMPNLNVSNRDGETPLHKSASPIGQTLFKSNETPPLAMHILADKVSSLNLMDHYGSNLLDVAAKHNYGLIAQKVIAIGNVSFNILNKLRLAPHAEGLQLSEKSDDYMKFLTSGRICPEIPTVPNSTLILSDSVMGHTLRIGDMVTYRCDSGFTRIGNPHIFCQEYNGATTFVPDVPSCVSIQEVKKIKDTSLLFYSLLLLLLLLLIFGLYRMNQSNEDRGADGE